MQRDPQVRACLTTKRLSVLSETAEVHPADSSAEAKRAAAIVEAALNQIPGGIAGIVTGALEALAMGYAVGELVWGAEGQLSEIRWHDPRRWQFVSDDYGNIVELQLRDHGLYFPREAFVVYSYQARYGNPYGESDLMGAYRPWSQKDLVQRMWLSALDRFGAPIPVATVPLTWTQSEVDTLSSLLAKLQNESALVVTNDVELSTALQEGRVEPARAFHVASEWLDTQIARAILGQDLTTNGTGGSYAMAKVHQDVLNQWIAALRTDLAEVALGQVSKAVCTMMMGPAAPAPKLRFPNLSEGEMTARRELVQSMVTGGIVAPGENWIRRYLGIPAADSQ